MVLGAALVLAVLVALLYQSTPRAAVVSSEMQFVERTDEGMQILPASCASTADYPGGDCLPPADKPPEIPPVYCNIVATDYSIYQGETTTLSWAAAPYNAGNNAYYDSSIGVTYTPTFSISPTVGAVTRNGAINVSPLTTTTYTLTISGADAYYSYQRNCDATINVTPCTPVLSCVGNGVHNSCTGLVTSCGAGEECVTGQCQLDCQVGYTLNLAPGTPTFTNVGVAKMRVNWSAPPGATGYKLERCTGLGCTNFAEIATGVPYTQYNDQGLSANTYYRYRVRATRNIGDSPYSGLGTRRTTN